MILDRQYSEFGTWLWRGEIGSDMEVRDVERKGGGVRIQGCEPTRDDYTVVPFIRRFESDDSVS